MCDILTTFSGKYILGINAPHKNALPKATTLTIPPIASLLLTSELISKAKVNACKVNTSVFNTIVVILLYLINFYQVI